MLILDKQYFKPTTKLRTLALLQALAGDQNASQHELGSKTAMSSAMVNSYLKDLHKAKLVSFKPVNGKSYSYHLTEPGDGKRRELFGEYCAEVVQAYSTMKAVVRSKLQPLADKGLTRLIFYGASDTCEVALTALSGTAFTVMALVDGDPAKHGRFFHGYCVFPPSILEQVNCQAVVITSFGKQDEIYASLRGKFTRNDLEIVRL